MREAATKFVLLGSIDALKTASGYEIRQFIQLAVGNFWNESFGQIYPALKSLADDGLIAAESTETGPRERRRFKITAKGRAALKDWVKKSLHPERPRSELLLKLFFGKFGDSGWARSVLQGAREHSVKAQKIAAAGFDQTIIDDARDPALVYYLIVTDAGRTILDAQRRWAERAIEMLDAFEAGGNEAVIALATAKDGQADTQERVWRAKH